MKIAAKIINKTGRMGYCNHVQQLEQEYFEKVGVKSLEVELEREIIQAEEDNDDSLSSDFTSKIRLVKELKRHLQQPTFLIHLIK